METRHARSRDVLACAAPFLVLALLHAVRLASPEAYTRYVFDRGYREYQVVEILTVVAAFAAGLVLVRAAAALRRAGGSGAAPRGTLGAVAILASAGAAALFYAGEELNWGQWLWTWGTPVQTVKAEEGYLCLHNKDIVPVKELGVLYLVGLFFLAPLAWRHRARLRLPAGLAPAIAGRAAVVNLAVALAWEPDLFQVAPVRDLALALLAATGHPDPGAAHAGFLDQLDEQKELLIAVALLVYALYASSAVRRSSPPGNGSPR